MAGIGNPGTVAGTTGGAGSVSAGNFQPTTGVQGGTGPGSQGPTTGVTGTTYGYPTTSTLGVSGTATVPIDWGGTVAGAQLHDAYATFRKGFQVDLPLVQQQIRWLANRPL